MEVERKVVERLRWSLLGHTSILLITDLFQPVDHLAFLFFLDGDVRHRGGWRGAMPVLLAGSEPNHVARVDFLDRSSFALSSTAAGRDDERLAERMRVPCSPRAGLEGYAGTLNKCRIGRLE